MLIKWESVQAFTNEISQNLTAGNKYHAKSSWLGNKTLEQALDLSIHGDDSTAAKAQKLIDKLEIPSIETLRDVWLPGIAGAYPIVPEYLSGEPQCMRQRMNEQSDVAPVNIYLNICTSSSWSANDLLKRGTTVLAFTLALQSVRPVEIHLVGHFDQSPKTNNETLFFDVLLDSKPLNLSQAAYVIADCSYIRHLWWEMVWYKKGTSKESDAIYWGNEYKSAETSDYPKFEKVIRKNLQMADQDLYIPMAYTSDTLITEPITWINKQLARYTQTGE